MAPKYVLTYLPVPGRAEVARLMFVLAGVEFTDVHISDEEFQKVKYDSKRFPLAQMPTLEIDGRVTIQAFAIWRYLANEFGFYGANNEETFLIDQVHETLTDHFSNVLGILYSPGTEEEKKTKYDELFAKDATKRYFTFVINMLKNNNDATGFVVGNKISLADLVIFVQHDIISRVYPIYINPYPEWKALIERIKSIESIQNYLASRKY